MEVNKTPRSTEFDIKLAGLRRDAIHTTSPTEQKKEFLELAINYYQESINLIKTQIDPVLERANKNLRDQKSILLPYMQIPLKLHEAAKEWAEGQFKEYMQKPDRDIKEALRKAMNQCDKEDIELLKKADEEAFKRHNKGISTQAKQMQIRQMPPPNLKGFVEEYSDEVTEPPSGLYGSYIEVRIRVNNVINNAMQIPNELYEEAKRQARIQFDNNMQKPDQRYNESFERVKEQLDDKAVSFLTTLQTEASKRAEEQLNDTLMRIGVMPLSKEQLGQVLEQTREQLEEFTKKLLKKTA